MKKYILTLFAAALSTQTFAADDTEFAVGLGAGYSTNSYVKYDNEFDALPLIHYDGPHFYVEGMGAGVKLFRTDDDSQELLLGISYLNYGFKPHKSDDARLKRLDKRKDGVMADFAYNIYTPYGNWENSVSQDISGRSKGLQARTQYSYSWEVLPSLWFKPAIGLTYANKKFNHYYYGVNQEESLRSGPPAYQPKASVQPYAELLASYDFNKNWQIFAAVRVEKLTNKIHNSPMVEDKYKTESVVGVMYRF